MKAVAIEAFGGPDGLAVVELSDPRAGRGEVVLTTEAIGVGGLDALIRKGALAAFGFEPGYVLGAEVVGTVSAVGEGVDPAWIGQRAWGPTGTGGGYAEQAVVAAGSLVPVPARVSSADAVTLGVSGIVARFGLRHARFAPGDKVLIRGASGGLGIMAVELAARGGADVVAVTTSSAERGERLRERGATVVLDRAGEGDDESADYDVIFDVVAGPDTPRFLTKLAPGGRMVAVGAVGGLPPAAFGIELLSAFRKSWSYGTFSADTVTEADKRAATAEHFAAAARGELRSFAHQQLPLERAADAHRMLETGEVFGMVVLAP